MIRRRSEATDLDTASFNFHARSLAIAEFLPRMGHAILATSSSHS
jgi:hypothetical protein